jgi:hypothetical protein
VVTRFLGLNTVRDLQFENRKNEKGLVHFRGVIGRNCPIGLDKVLGFVEHTQNIDNLATIFLAKATKMMNLYMKYMCNIIIS